jgi:hypothetical protein
LAQQPYASKKCCVRLLARPGRFLGRKRYGEPGVKAIWLAPGLQRVMDFAPGINFAREARNLRACVQ